MGGRKKKGGDLDPNQPEASGSQKASSSQQPKQSTGSSQQQKQQTGSSQQQKQQIGSSQQQKQPTGSTQQQKQPTGSQERPKQQPDNSNRQQGSQKDQKPKDHGQQGATKEQKKPIKNAWKCLSCGFDQNFANKTCCHKCNEPRETTQPPQSDQQPRQKQAAQNLPPKTAQQKSKQIQDQPKAQSAQQSHQPRQTQGRPQSSGSEASSIASSMRNLKLTSTKPSKYSSSFAIESSANPSKYEGTRGKKCILEVNYGKITLDPKKLPKEAFHYDVTFDPETPKKFLPYALAEFMRVCFRDFIYGSDNRKNIYTAMPLVHDGNNIEEFQQEITARMGDRTKDFKVKVKYTGSKDMSILLKYTNSIYQNEDKPMEAIQALDVILRKPFQSVGGTIQVLKGLYFAPTEHKSLGDGIELWYGLFQSAIMGRSAIYLNVDVLHKAFPSAITLLQFISENFRDRNNQVPSSLQGWQENALKNHLKMLTIGYRFQNEYKTYGFNDLISPKNATFTDDNGRKTHVKDYYQNQKGVRLEWPNMPYLWVGSRNRKIYLPLEFCEIPAGQATNKKCSPNATAQIIKFSATTTEERKQKIKDLLAQINYKNDPTVTGFGINVDKNFQNIEGRIVNPPLIKYSEGTVQPKDGAWNGKTFLDSAKVTQGKGIKWCIINCDERTTQQNLMRFKNDFMKAAKTQKVPLEDINKDDIVMMEMGKDFKFDIEKELGICLEMGYQLVVVIIVDKNDCYGRVKQAAELKVGILTQCIKANTIFKMGRGNPMMTINNILLKVNAKLNGKNHEVEEISYKTFNQKGSGVMFVGADVTHPSPDQRSIPSVVGVASSYDDVGFRYCCDCRLQEPNEMIKDLDDILVKHLKFYESRNKCLPAKILYYRDGVSDGEFKKVLAEELSAIKDAIKRVYGNKTTAAEITFIVVQKRHHTRFFPTQKEFSNGKFHNIMPGTVVDKNIVHPFQYQFFMASHAAIQGVTKPTKYCILINESNIAPDDLQAITYDLCHLFTRCNRSVSYPAPTYYAHLVAARGKNYIAGDRINLSNLKHENQMRTIQPAIVNGAPMFFV